MDIDDLKKAWDKYSSIEQGKELDEDAIRKMLSGRTKSLIERIDRNIKIGFFIILALILFFIIDDLMISPVLLNGIASDLHIPGWLVVLDIFTNLAIIVTFVIFVNKYYRVKRECDISCNLAGALAKIIDILTLYQRMFYYAIFVLLASTATGFMVGLFKGMEYSAEISGIAPGEIKPLHVAITIIVGLVVLGLLSFGLFALFRWGFRRLYGNYLQKLKATQTELNELE
jgi:hypothetical protein